MKGGTWSFFYEDSAGPGTFHKFAELANVTSAIHLNWADGTLVSNTMGTPVPVADVILPTDFSSFGFGLLNVSGVLSNETTLVDPTTDEVGLFGVFSLSGSVTFDVENAVLISEPSGVVLTIIGGLGFIVWTSVCQRRRQVRVQTVRRSVCQAIDSWSLL